MKGGNLASCISRKGRRNVKGKCNKVYSYFESWNLTVMNHVTTPGANHGLTFHEQSLPEVRLHPHANISNQNKAARDGSWELPPGLTLSMKKYGSEMCTILVTI